LLSKTVLQLKALKGLLGELVCKKEIQ